MDDFITRNSTEYVELRKIVLRALKTVNLLINEHRPSIFNEVYLTGEEVRTMFNISPRSLQTYRDERIIPYTNIGGKFLYPQSALYGILERNYMKSLR